MTANKRLCAIVGLLFLSGAYAALVKIDPTVASAMALGYVAFLLSVLVIINRWRRP